LSTSSSSSSSSSINKRGGAAAAAWSGRGWPGWGQLDGFGLDDFQALVSHFAG